MTDIKKICDAMAALAAAIPGTGHTGVFLHECDDVTLRILVENGATCDRYESDDHSQEWDCARLLRDDITVYAFSKHRPIVRADIDEAAVDYALALAEEAVRP